MLLRFSTLCIFFLLCEAATKIGLGNGRPSEETSSLKTEILKFKTSECGGSSTEESMKRNQRNRHKNQEDEDDDSEEDTKRRRNKGRNRNRGRGIREEYMVYGRSFEDRRTDNYNRQDNSFQRWDENYNRNRNQYGPYFGNNEEDFYQNNNRRHNNRDQEQPGHYNNRDRDQDNFNQRPKQHNRNRYNYQEEDTYSNRRNNRKKQNHDWNDDEDEDNDDYDRKGSKRRNRNQNKRGKKQKNKDDNTEECVSQCVFNNMEIMEDDGIPSEAGMIKWAQEKIKNEKLKQAAVKEIRRCFGTLASSDGENSCNFSKSLANCLKLGLDEDKD